MPVAINKLCKQIGLTSRTLRHWESEGLFSSGKNLESGWRMYDDDAVMRIRLTAFLRRYNFPIREIKQVIQERTYERLREAILAYLNRLGERREEDEHMESRLTRLLGYVTEREQSLLTVSSLEEFESLTLTHSSDRRDMEDYHMSTQNQIKVVVLPAMRTVCNTAVSVSPEDEAMNPVFEWIASEKLSGTARFFGFDVEPWPNGNAPYGYAMCASIPEGVMIPQGMTERRMEGGLYAVLDSDEDIGGSWKRLMKMLENHDLYEADQNRQCLEETIPSMKEDGKNQGVSIVLMEPVKQK